MIRKTIYKIQYKYLFCRGICKAIYLGLKYPRLGIIPSIRHFISWDKYHRADCDQSSVLYKELTQHETLKRTPGIPDGE